MTRLQCKKCPWRVGTNPDEIEGEYSRQKHRALSGTIAVPGDLNLDGEFRMMACHESDVGNELPCVGWLVNQMGQGNNLMLRILVYYGKVDADVEVVGPQYDQFEDTIPK